MSVEEKAKTPCISHRMPNCRVHGGKCQCSHVKAPPAKPKTQKPIQKPSESLRHRKSQQRSTSLRRWALLPLRLRPSGLLSRPLTLAQVDTWCRTKLCRNRGITAPSCPKLPMTPMRNCFFHKRWFQEIVQYHWVPRPRWNFR